MKNACFQRNILCSFKNLTGHKCYNTYTNKFTKQLIRHSGRFIPQDTVDNHVEPDRLAGLKALVIADQAKIA